MLFVLRIKWLRVVSLEFELRLYERLFSTWIVFLMIWWSDDLLNTESTMVELDSVYIDGSLHSGICHGKSNVCFMNRGEASRQLWRVILDGFRIGKTLVEPSRTRAKSPQWGASLPL